MSLMLCGLKVLIMGRKHRSIGGNDNAFREMPDVMSNSPGGRGTAIYGLYIYVPL